MWGKPTEARRLIALRRAALKALDGAPPFSERIELTLAVHVGAANSRLAGDLDNYVTGICDGLMAADPRSKLNTIFDDAQYQDIEPAKVIAICDDSEVVMINAQKLFGRGDSRWYEIGLSGL